jgi:hypothetical protein
MNIEVRGPLFMSTGAFLNLRGVEELYKCPRANVLATCEPLSTSTPSPWFEGLPSGSGLLH